MIKLQRNAVNLGKGIYKARDILYAEEDCVFNLIWNGQKSIPYCLTEGQKRDISDVENIIVIDGSITMYYKEQKWKC